MKRLTMKRLLVLTVALVAVLSFAACNGPNDDPITATDATEATEATENYIEEEEFIDVDPGWEEVETSDEQLIAD